MITLVHDPDVVRARDCAYCTDGPDAPTGIPWGERRGEDVAAPFVAHGISPWLAGTGLAVGADGWLLTVECDYHPREIIGAFTGALVTALSAQSCRCPNPLPPPPPPAGADSGTGGGTTG